MVLVDTSVWIDHLRVGDRKLVRLLEDGEVGVHPLVIGELACGNLRNRREILALLADLPSVERVSDEEVLFFIERHRLSGRGLGLVDVHLLASCAAGEVALWTKDARLMKVARQLGLGEV
jgi:predicted nucleic acid-binding protein